MSTRSHRVSPVFTQVLNRDELAALFAWRPPLGDTFAFRDSLVLHLLAQTGIRRGELSKATHADYSTLAGHVWLTVQSKRERRRRLPLEPWLWSRLVGFWKYTTFPTEFPRYLGARPLVYSLHPYRGWGFLPGRRIYKIVRRRTAELLGFPVRPHVLRHSIATMWLQGGADVRTVQVMLGHYSIAATQRYLHTTQEQILQAVSTSTRLLVGPTQQMLFKPEVPGLYDTGIPEVS